MLKITEQCDFDPFQELHFVGNGLCKMIFTGAVNFDKGEGHHDLAFRHLTVSAYQL